MDINTPNRIPQSIYTHTSEDSSVKIRVSEVTPIRRIPVLTDQLLRQGKIEQAKNEAIKIEEDKQTVSDLIKKSNRCIISISSRFPWTLFPNTIEVEESRVTCIFRQFLTSQSHSIDIKDISNVFIQTSPFFATLQIVSRTYIENEITVGHLDAKKAQQVQIIIEGLRTFAEHNIDTSNYEIKELVAKIEEFHTFKSTTGGEVK